METISLKALAVKVLKGNPEGNQWETKSFLRGKQKDNQETTQETKAKGYGCGACGNRIYRAVESWIITEMPDSSTWSHEYIIEQHWQCEQCEVVYQWIGGEVGPKFIN